MTEQLHDYEWIKFERWIKIEYPDMAEEFDCLPKTLADFIRERYGYLVAEYIESERPENILYWRAK